MDRKFSTNKNRKENPKSQRRSKGRGVTGKRREDAPAKRLSASKCIVSAFLQAKPVQSRVGALTAPTPSLIDKRSRSLSTKARAKESCVKNARAKNPTVRKNTASASIPDRRVQMSVNV